MEVLRRPCHHPFSAALCRGLIEASSVERSPVLREPCFPRLYAAASLKLLVAPPRVDVPGPFSAALCRGLIEARACEKARSSFTAGFPRLYAAASLKRVARHTAHSSASAVFRALCRGLIEAVVPATPLVAQSRVFSAALCRGLIEAARPLLPRFEPRHCFPRLYAAASLKHTLALSRVCYPRVVFRGFMPRPH